MAKGRPSKYTPALAAEICERLAGGQSLREICRDEAMPGISTARKWITTDEQGFSAQYARARDAQFERWSEEILEISDDGSNDYMIRNPGQDDEQEVFNSEHVQRSKLRVDSRKWLLSKLKPGTYGDKLQHAGADGTGPLIVQIIKPA